MLLFLILYLLLVTSLLCYGLSFRYLIKVMGDYGGYEINSIFGVFKFAINPFSLIKLYKIFLNMAEDNAGNKDRYQKILTLNIVSYISFVCLMLVITTFAGKT